MSTSHQSVLSSLHCSSSFRSVPCRFISPVHTSSAAPASVTAGTLTCEILCVSTSLKWLLYFTWAFFLFLLSVTPHQFFPLYLFPFADGFSIIVSSSILESFSSLLSLLHTHICEMLQHTFDVTFSVFSSITVT